MTYKEVGCGMGWTLRVFRCRQGASFGTFIGGEERAEGDGEPSFVLRDTAEYAPNYGV